MFVLIHAPWEFLCEQAEKMMIRVPLREPDGKPKNLGKMKKFKNTASHLNPFRVKAPAVGKERKYITTFFRKDQLSSFLTKDKETFFGSNDRSRMVKFVLNSARYSEALEDFGIDRLVDEGVYTYSYRLHEGICIIFFLDITGGTCALLNSRINL